MSICKKKDSPYYYTRFTIGGIRIQESTRTTVKSEAQRYEEKRRKEVREYVLLGGKPRRTWAEAKLKWLSEMQHKRSIYNDIVHFDWLQTHLDHFCLEDITKDLIENISQKKVAENVSPATVNRVLALIRSVLNKACKQWEWINRVPHIAMKPEDNKRVRWLTKNEAELLLKELPRHLRVMAKFTLATGLRARNVSFLEWKNINMQSRHAVILPDQNKTKKYLGIPLNQDAINVIKEQIGKDGKYIFVYRGKPITQCSTRAWRNALKRAGIENFRWHDLRHTWASWHVQSGTSLQELAELGGWANMEMVLRYAHLSSKQLENAADRISGAKMVKSNLKLVENI